MEKVKLDYVFSGTTMFRLIPEKKYAEYMSDDDLLIRNTIVKMGVKKISEILNNRIKNSKVTLSLLYNAYTEPESGHYYFNNENLGFDNLYADSGGLQVISEGKSLSSDLKKQIYKNQDISNVSFCFDEIPVNILDDTLVSTKHGNINNKLFDYSRFKECAIYTANNVKEQLESLESSKISYIVQGNTYKDMIEWVDIGFDVLGDDNIKKLHGIALAGTCMGNGELETCDMMYVVHHIFKKYPLLKHNLHLLGFGSSKRLLPVYILNKSGFIPTDTVISADSTTHSMSFVMGRTFNIDNTKSTFESYKHFVSDLESIFKLYVDDFDIDELSNIINDNRRLCGAFGDVCSDKNHKYYNLARCIVPLYSIWTVQKMFIELDKSIEYNDRFLSLLTEVTNDNEYIIWRSKYHHKIKSNRIKRKRNSLF